MSVFKDRVNYTHNDIVKPFRVGIRQYAENVHEVHNIAKYIPTPSMEGDEYDHEDWNVRNKYLSEYEIQVVTRYGLPISIYDEMGDKDKDYHSFPH